MSKGKNIAGWVLAVVLGAVFIMAGAGKFSGGAAEMFAGWGYPAWFAVFIGVSEVLGGIGLLIPRITRFAIMGLSLIMLGAAYTHATNGEAMEVARPLGFLAALWLLMWLRCLPGRVRA